MRIFINDNKFPLASDGTNNSLYDELWKFCGGPMFDLPKFGEQVYYFPHGHMEQVSFYLFVFPCFLFPQLWLVKVNNLVILLAWSIFQ